jgi:hypothetical protein
MGEMATGTMVADSGLPLRSFLDDLGHTHGPDAILDALPKPLSPTIVDDMPLVVV